MEQSGVRQTVQPKRLSLETIRLASNGNTVSKLDPRPASRCRTMPIDNRTIACLLLVRFHTLSAAMSMSQSILSVDARISGRVEVAHMHSEFDASVIPAVASFPQRKWIADETQSIGHI